MTTSNRATRWGRIGAAALEVTLAAPAGIAHAVDEESARVEPAAQVLRARGCPSPLDKNA